MPSSHAARAKIDEKSFENLRKSIPNRRKIDLGPVWAPKVFSGMRPDALGTVSGHPNDAPRPILGRPRRAKSAQEPSKSVPGPPRDARRGFRRAFGTGFPHDVGKQACRKARRANFVQFFVIRVLSRDGSDVHETSVLMVFQHDSSMFASHECAHAGASKKQPFRP